MTTELELGSRPLSLTDLRTDGTRWTLRALGERPQRGGAAPAAADVVRTGED